MYDDNYYTDVTTNANDLLEDYKKPSVKRADKNYEKYQIHFGKKRVSIENHGSGQIGSRVRNAVTGHLYPFLVGSRDEYSLFKVIDSTARGGKNYPLMLYYDSPEQYEKHHYVNLSLDVKQRWYKSGTQGTAF